MSFNKRPPTLTLSSNLLKISPEGRGNLHKLLNQKRFIVCVGSGGVGKTTISCALGLLAAQLGKKTLIVTIDPAKRLADALGISLGETPKALPTQANCFAMMLDMQHAWDNMVMRLSTTAEMRDEVLQNRFYKYLSQDMAGSQEFVACEALYTLAQEHDFDTIILDTPPTSNALDFLDAPKKILGFLDQQAFHYFLQPKNTIMGKLSMGFLGSASALIHNLLERFTGKTFVEEFIDFMRVLRELYPPIIARTKAFQQLLKSAESSFVIVCAAKEASIKEASIFQKELTTREYDIGLIICNKVTKNLQNNIGQENIDNVRKSIAVDIEKILKEHEVNARHDKKLINALQKQCAQTPLIAVPKLMADSNENGTLNELLRFLQNQ